MDAADDVATTTPPTRSTSAVNVPTFLVNTSADASTAMTTPVAALVSPVIVSPATTVPVMVQAITWYCASLGRGVPSVRQYPCTRR